MSETKKAKSTGTDNRQPSKNKVGYIVAIALGLFIVCLLAVYFIFMGLNHAGRWESIDYGAVKYSTFRQTDFIIVKSRDDLDEYFYSADRAINRYRIDVKNYDYLIVKYDYVNTESGFYQTLTDARIDEITADGVAKMSFSYRARLFSSVQYDTSDGSDVVLFEGEKGSFDNVKSVQFPGITPVEPDEPDPDPDEPRDYLSLGIYIFEDYGLNDNTDIRIFDNYQDYITYLGGFDSFTSTTVNASYFDDYDIAVVPVVQGDCGGRVEKVGLYSISNRTATVIAEMHGTCGPCAPEYFYYAVPINKGRADKINLKYEIVNTYHCDPDVAYKPVIYLYPTKATDISVKLGAPEKLLVSYPTYIDGWKVKAQPNGDLVDQKTGRELYSLYYEANNTTTHGLHQTGFVVKGEDTTSFLEEKLAQLGLNQHEAEEFIIYWLPQMQNNPYNYIYFATGDEASKNMPLEVSPAPKTSIRINMEWKALDAPIKVKPQTLPATPIRDGFTLVEWGGTIL